MNLMPIENQAQGPLRHVPFDDTGLNFNYNLLVFVPGMEMWRIVILIIQKNNNSIKSADYRHFLQVGSAHPS